MYIVIIACSIIMDSIIFKESSDFRGWWLFQSVLWRRFGHNESPNRSDLWKGTQTVFEIIDIEKRRFCFIIIYGTNLGQRDWSSNLQVL